MINKFVKSIAGGIVGFGMLLSSTALAARVPIKTSFSLSPFVVLSIYGTIQSRAAVCSAAVGAAAGSAEALTQAPVRGCLLSQVKAAPWVTFGSVAVAPGTRVTVATPAPGTGIRALLAGLVRAAGSAAIMLNGKNNNGKLPIGPD